MRRHFVYILAAALLILAQANIVTLFSIRNVTPDLLLIFIASLAVREGQLYTLPWGFLIGLVIDLTTGTVIGLSALSKTAAAFTAGFFYGENKVMLNVATYRFLVVVFITAFIHNAVYFLIFTQGSDVGIFGAVFGIGLASTLFTTTVAVLPMLVAARKRGTI